MYIIRQIDTGLYVRFNRHQFAFNYVENPTEASAYINLVNAERKAEEMTRELGKGFEVCPQGEFFS